MHKADKNMLRSRWRMISPSQHSAQQQCEKNSFLEFFLSEFRFGNEDRNWNGNGRNESLAVILSNLESDI